ncbi:hypothetical protein [Mucilaginibacter paludis]|uniref:hypothetical protein n=1 Tax=Mucilaginibacter paludis TaxID=423351 RepID=UPI00059059AC|nr:hypothetical protein [Mucilaginibacter paludis]
MKKDPYFDNHPIYSALSYDAIVGLIQLLIDEGLVAATERDGLYIVFKDFREKVRPTYQRLTEAEKLEYIAYFRYRHHLNNPYIP